MGTGSLLGVKSGQGVTLTPHPLLVPRSRKSRAIPLLPLWAARPVQSLSACTRVHFTFTCTSTRPMGRTACTEPQCLYKGALYLYMYLYSPYGPYGLYRASVPVQGCTLPLPLLIHYPVATRYTVDRPGFEYREGQEIFFSKAVKTDRDKFSCPYNRQWVGFPELRWQRCGINYSLPSRAEIKNTWSYTYTPPVCLHGLERDYFTFIRF